MSRRHRKLRQDILDHIENNRNAALYGDSRIGISSQPQYVDHSFDAFEIVVNELENDVELIYNIFCATGIGGGIDSTCKKGESKGAGVGQDKDMKSTAQKVLQLKLSGKATRDKYVDLLSQHHPDDLRGVKDRVLKMAKDGAQRDRLHKIMHDAIQKSHEKRGTSDVGSRRSRSDESRDGKDGGRVEGKTKESSTKADDKRGKDNDKPNGDKSTKDVQKKRRSKDRIQTGETENY